MSKLSQRSRSPRVIEHLSAQIVDAALALRSREDFALFFDDLLTRTEKAMLGKRILIAVFLEKGFSYVEIEQALKVSQATISAVSERLERDGRGLRTVIRALERRKRIEEIVDQVKKIFESLPKKYGPRWRLLRHL